MVRIQVFVYLFYDSLDSDSNHKFEGANPHHAVIFYQIYPLIELIVS